ncbi:MAG TPA: hypothetical protein VIV61_14810 [Candidatus Ozemobacteraceae bacterium]
MRRSLEEGKQAVERAWLRGVERNGLLQMSVVRPCCTSREVLNTVLRKDVVKKMKPARLDKRRKKRTQDEKRERDQNLPV